MEKEQHSTPGYNPANTAEIKKTLEELNENLQQAGNNPIKQALKMEQQPSFESDFSPLNNNRQTGTTGADQRASNAEDSQKFEPVQNSISTSGIDPKEPITEDPNEKDLPVREDPDEKEIPEVKDPEEEKAPVEYEPGGDGEPEVDYKEPETEKGSEEIFYEIKKPRFVL